jgi:hypothetical protein
MQIVMGGACQVPPFLIRNCLIRKPVSPGGQSPNLYEDNRFFVLSDDVNLPFTARVVYRPYAIPLAPEKLPGEFLPLPAELICLFSHARQLRPSIIHKAFHRAHDSTIPLDQSAHQTEARGVPLSPTLHPGPFPQQRKGSETSPKTLDNTAPPCHMSSRQDDRVRPYYRGDLLRPFKAWMIRFDWDPGRCPGL